MVDVATHTIPEEVIRESTKGLGSTHMASQWGRVEFCQKQGNGLSSQSEILAADESCVVSHGRPRIGEQRA